MDMVGGWTVPFWKRLDFVNWDDDIPNILHKKMFQTTNQDIHVAFFPIVWTNVWFSTPIQKGGSKVSLALVHLIRIRVSSSMI